MKKPVLIFCKQSKEKNINSVVQFFENDKPDLFANLIIKYFAFDKNELYGKCGAERKKYIEKSLMENLKEYQKTANEIIFSYQNYWDNVCEQITKQLESVFEINFCGIKKCSAYLTINVICPRYLDDWSFEVNYKLSPKKATQIAIHELIHFLWFEKWRTIFKNCDKKQFENPDPVWLLSEIAIEPIIKNSPLKKYFLTSRPAYKYFYKIKINNKSLFEIINDLYNNNDIENFMKKGLDFVKQNYDKIIR